MIATLTAQIRAAQDEMAKAQADFQAAAAEVMKNCPPECWGDLTMPAC